MRFVFSLSLCAVAFVAADELRAALGHRIDAVRPGTWFFGGSVLLQAFAGYFLPFFVAGAISAWLMSASRGALWAAVGLGFAVPLSGLANAGLLPFAAVTHGPWWHNAVGWSNWFGPPVGAACGAILAQHLWPNPSSKRAPDGAGDVQH